MEPAKRKQPQNSTSFTQTQISLGVSSAVEFVLGDGNSNVLLGLGGLARGGVTSYL